MIPDVSLFASANRPDLWTDLFKSLFGTTCRVEVVFCGNISPTCAIPSYINFKFIKTGFIKPAQCYEIARRNCSGETVMWVADDAEFPNDIIGKAYKYWKSQRNKKLILSIQTKESGYNTPKMEFFKMENHRFFGGKLNTPLMAPIGLMSRDFLDDIGGFDKRFICGQYENFCVMMAYERGGIVEVFGNTYGNCHIEIDHLTKSIKIGESTGQHNFIKRPFASSYDHDRSVLEGSWTKYNKNIHMRLLAKIWDPFRKYRKLSPARYKDVTLTMVDEFQPYSKDISILMSEGPRGEWQ